MWLWLWWASAAPWSVLRLAPAAPLPTKGSISISGAEAPPAEAPPGDSGCCLPSAGGEELPFDMLIRLKRPGVLSPPLRLEETGVPPLEDPPAFDPASAPVSLFLLLTFSRPIDSLADVALVLALPKRDRLEDVGGAFEEGMLASRRPSRGPGDC